VWLSHTVPDMGRNRATACCRELGAELRRRRQAAGLSGPQLAHRAGWQPAKISRMETGHVNASDVDVLHYLGFCGVYLGQAKEIMALCRRAEDDRGYWLNPHPVRLDDSLCSLIYHEATASSSLSYEPQAIPGLLQTEAYARAMIHRYGSTAGVEPAVRTRLDRQRVLHRPRSARFTFLLHEHALQPVVDRAIMHEQLLTLMLLDGLPHVTVRVVPAPAMFGGAFRLLRFARHEPLVYLDCHVAGLFLEDKEFVDHYLALIPAIADVALDEGQSREFIAALADEFDRGSIADRVEEKQL
jgi:transcriptional regulator with XRE-family HTH domain